MGVGTAAAAAALAFALGTVGVAVVPAAASYRAEAATLPVGRVSGCMVRDRPFVPSDIDRCYTRVARPNGWIMLVGDSHADAISNGVVTAATRLGYDVLTLTGAQCEFARHPAPSNFMPNCAAMNNDLLDQATGTNPARAGRHVALGRGLPRNRTRLAAGSQSHHQRTPPAEHSCPVLSVLDVPNFAAWDAGQPAACRGGLLDFTCTLPREEVEAIQGSARAAEIALTRGRPGVTVYDPWPRFCTATACSSVVHGRLAYRDFAHLNAIGGALLAPDLQRAMRTAMRGQDVAAPLTGMDLQSARGSASGVAGCPARPAEGDADEQPATIADWVDVRPHLHHCHEAVTFRDGPGAGRRCCEVDHRGQPWLGPI